MTEASGGLSDLVDALRWRWKPAAAIALFIFAGAYVYIRTLPSEYDGKAIVSISPRANTQAGADTVRVEAPKYVSFAEAPETARTVSGLVGVPATTLDKAVNATVPVDTGNVSIVVRLRNPNRAAAAANAVADQVVSFSKTDPLLTAQVVSRALPPTAPAAPPRRLLEAASLFVGVLIGVGVSLLLERSRPRLHSWRDMARLTGYPVVGRVPSRRILRNQPTEAFADPIAGSAFRTLRANIEPQLREQNIDLLLVTSPGNGDGKTTVAALLAESLGRLGARVLLVDADLKRPGLAQLAKLNGHPGLADVLRARATLGESVRPGWIDELSLLPTAADRDVGDLLPRHFGEVVKQARVEYDLIVVDAPPLLGTDDARVLAPLVAGVILVVSAGSAANPVNEAVLTIESLKAPLLGIVGNRLKESRRLYY